MSTKEDESTIDKALAALPEAEREAFVLRSTYGLTYVAIARRLGLSEEEALMLLKRAHVAVRPALPPDPRPSALIGVLAVVGVLCLIASWFAFRSYGDLRLFCPVLVALGVLCIFGATKLWLETGEI